MSMEVSKRWYVGTGRNGQQRFVNIKKLAVMYFGGNVSKLVNDALNKAYNLDPETGEPLAPDSLPPLPHPKKKFF